MLCIAGELVLQTKSMEHKYNGYNQYFDCHCTSCTVDLLPLTNFSKQVSHPLSPLLSFNAVELKMQVTGGYIYRYLDMYTPIHVVWSISRRMRPALGSTIQRYIVGRSL